MYVRASVSDLDEEQRAPHDVYPAIYRMPARYEELFRAAGLRCIGSWPSERRLLEGMASARPGPARAAGLASAAALAPLASAIQRRIDRVGYRNWILTF